MIIKVWIPITDMIVIWPYKRTEPWRGKPYDNALTNVNKTYWLCDINYTSQFQVEADIVITETGSQIDTIVPVTTINENMKTNIYTAVYMWNISSL